MKTKRNTNVSRCIDGTSFLQDNVKIYIYECQAQSVATDPMLRGANFSFFSKGL